MNCCGPSRRQALLWAALAATAWSQRTRGEYYGLYPHYMLGTIADRNHTVVRDLSGLRPPS
jgi:hypothetical protein